MKESEEQIIANRAKAIAAMDVQMYTLVEIEWRRVIANHRKAIYDSHISAGFTPEQALHIARLSI